MWKSIYLRYVYTSTALYLVANAFIAAPWIYCKIIIIKFISSQWTYYNTSVVYVTSLQVNATSVYVCILGPVPIIDVQTHRNPRPLPPKSPFLPPSKVALLE